MQFTGTRWTMVLSTMALLTMVGGCGSFARPTADIVNVSFQDLSLESITIVFDVDVKNPYSQPLPLANLDYSLASRGSMFMSGKADVQGTVPANGAKTIPLPAKVTFKELFSLLKDVRLGSVVPYNAEMGLSVDAPIVGKMRLPIKKDGQLPIPTVPDVEVREIKWDKLGLDQASGRIRLSMVNRNQFPVDLSKLRYALSLGDVEVANSSLAKAVAFGANDGQGEIELPINISPQQAGFGLFRMLSGSGSSYKFNGTMDVGTPFGPMSMPVQKAGNALFKR